MGDVPQYVINNMLLDTRTLQDKSNSTGSTPVPVPVDVAVR